MTDGPSAFDLGVCVDGSVKHNLAQERLEKLGSQERFWIVRHGDVAQFPQPENGRKTTAAMLLLLCGNEEDILVRG